MDSVREVLFLFRTIKDEDVWFATNAQSLIGDNQRKAAGTIATQAFTAGVHDLDGCDALGIDGDAGLPKFSGQGDGFFATGRRFGLAFGRELPVFRAGAPKIFAVFAEICRDSTFIGSDCMMHIEGGFCSFDFGIVVDGLLAPAGGVDSTQDREKQDSKTKLLTQLGTVVAVHTVFLSIRDDDHQNAVFVLALVKDEAPIAIWQVENLSHHLGSLFRS